MKELKLAVAGAVLAALTMACGVYCLLISIYSTDLTVLAVLVPSGDLLMDVYSWINPYLLLICSSDLLRHFQALLKFKWHQIGSRKINSMLKPEALRLAVWHRKGYGTLTELDDDTGLETNGARENSDLTLISEPRN